MEYLISLDFLAKDMENQESKFLSSRNEVSLEKKVQKVKCQPRSIVCSRSCKREYVQFLQTPSRSEQVAVQIHSIQFGKKNINLPENSQNTSHLKKGQNLHSYHGLRTPNEGINQRYLKNWADVADKICFSRTYKFSAVQ